MTLYYIVTQLKYESFISIYSESVL